MTRRLRPLLVLLALATLSAATFAQELERPSPPTTASIFLDGDPAAPPTPSETRTSYRQLEVRGPWGNPPLDDVVRVVLQKRMKALAPEFNLAPDAVADALEIHSGGNASPDEAEFRLHLALRPPAKAASREMMDRLLKGLPAELGQVRKQMADAALKELRDDHAERTARRDAARKRHGELVAQARQLTGQLEPSPQRVRAAAVELETEQQRIELDLLAKSARREAMEEEIARQSGAIEKKIADDAIAAELGKVVAAREKRLDVIREMVKNGHAGTSEVDEQVAVIAESRAKLLQRQREAANEAGGETLQSFNRELLTLSVDLRELRVRLDAIKKRLAEFGEALSKLEAAQEAEQEAVEAARLAESHAGAIREAEPFTARAGEVRASVTNKTDASNVDRRDVEPLQ